MDEIYLRIWGLARPHYLKGRAYDVPHIEWMMRQGEAVADLEGLDKDLLLPILILHDVGYSKIDQNNPDIKAVGPKIAHMQEGAKIAAQILEEVGYDSELTGRIVHYISVHDNWILGDDSPFEECKEMAAFNDLDFLYGQSSFAVLELQGKAMGLTPIDSYYRWLGDEKLTRRPFCCDYTRNLFEKLMAERKAELAI